MSKNPKMQHPAARRRRRRRGMTLIEIIVVIAILGLIMAAVGVAVVPMLGTAQQDRVGLDIKNIESGLKLYYTKKGRYPDTATGFRALVESQILEEMPRDPWGNEYVYMLEGGRPEIVSYGRDGQQGGEGPDGDISTSSLREQN